MRTFMMITLCAATLSAPVARGQSAADVAAAERFFATHDASGDGELSKPEFVDGFIAQSRADRPAQTNLIITLYGKGRIERCLGMAFDRADSNANATMSLAELGAAYREDAFDDLREIC